MLVGRVEKTFRANQGRAWVATVGIGSVVALTPLTVALEIVEHFWIPNWEYSDEPRALIFGAAYGSAGIALVIAYLVGVIGFLLWLHRTIVNAEALGRGMRNVSPGTAVLYWFVPILNLFRPYHVVTALYRRSDPGTTLTRDWVARWEWIPSVWWGTWVVSSMAGNVSGRMAWSDEPGRAGTVMWINLVAAPFGIAAGILVIALLWSIDVRLEHLARTDAPEPKLDAEAEQQFVA
jgi:hypothetical protein